MALFAGIDFSGMISALMVDNNVDGSIDQLAVQINKLQPSVIPGSKCKLEERVIDNSCLIVDDELKQSTNGVTVKLANFIRVYTFKTPKGSHHVHDNIHHQGAPHGHPLNSDESDFYQNSHLPVVHGHPGEPRELLSTDSKLAQGRPQEHEEVIVVFLDGDPMKPFYVPLAF